MGSARRTPLPLAGECSQRVHTFGAIGRPLEGLLRAPVAEPERTGDSGTAHPPGGLLSEPA